MKKRLYVIYNLECLIEEHLPLLKDAFIAIPSIPMLLSEYICNEWLIFEGNLFFILSVLHPPRSC